VIVKPSMDVKKTIPLQAPVIVFGEATLVIAFIGEVQDALSPKVLWLMVVLVSIDVVLLFVVPLPK